MRAVTRMALALWAGLAAATPASADLRVIYIDMQNAKQLHIEIDDNGDARIAEAGSDDYGLLLGGEFYIVDVEDGKATVARIRDVATAIDTVLPPIFKDLFAGGADAAPSTPLKIEPGETDSAGGRQGRIYHVSGFSGGNPERVTNYLINSDPDLKPVGKVLEQFMNAAIVPAAPLIGPGARELIAETRAIFALGTPIDIGGRFRLNLASKANYDPRVFKLPAAPVSVDQLVLSMRQSMAAKAPQN